MVAQEECCEDFDGGYYSNNEFEAQWFTDVSHVSVSPTLGLLPSVVRSAARELVTDLNEVYQDFVDSLDEDDEWPAGMVTFSVTVDASGNVTSVSVTGSGLDRELDDDLCGVMEGLNIPAPPDGAGTIQIQYSFQKIW